MTRSSTDYIVVHCSATRGDRDFGAADIDRWHTGPRFRKKTGKWRFAGAWHDERPDTDLPNGNGWGRIGYHRVIRLNGLIEHSLPLDAVGTHVRGFNGNGIGICLIGGIDADGKSAMTFTTEQLDSLKWLIDGLLIDYPDAEVLGHRDLSPDADGDGEVERHEWLKDCPCLDVKHWRETGEAVFSA